MQLAVSHADTDIKQPIGVEVLPPPVYPKLPKAALFGLVALAVLVQAMVARRGLKAHVATGVAIALAFAAYAPELVDPERPYDGVFGLMIAALIAGGVGLFAGYVATRVVRPKGPGQAAKGAA